MDSFTPAVAAVSQAIGVLVMVGQVGLVLLVIALLGRPFLNLQLRTFLARVSLPGAFVVALVSTVGSLFYSLGAHLVPCELCWYQRILMYPQVLLLGLALAGKNRDVRTQVLTLSILGAITAMYHIYLQHGGSPLAPCSVVGLTPDCADIVVQELGYITIPGMALTGFLLIIVLMLHARRGQSVQ